MDSSIPLPTKDELDRLMTSATPKPRAGEHTKGPWRVKLLATNNADIEAELGGVVANVARWNRGVAGTNDENTSNARRIVACVNALEGVSTEDIEARNVPQAWGAMVEAIMDAAEVMNYLATRHSSIEAMTKRGENCRELEARFRSILAKHGR